MPGLLPYANQTHRPARSLQSSCRFRQGQLKPATYYPGLEQEPIRGRTIGIIDGDCMSKSVAETLFKGHPCVGYPHDQDHQDNQRD